MCGLHEYSRSCPSHLFSVSFRHFIPTCLLLHTYQHMLCLVAIVDGTHIESPPRTW